MNQANCVLSAVHAMNTCCNYAYKTHARHWFITNIIELPPPQCTEPPLDRAAPPNPTLQKLSQNIPWTYAATLIWWCHTEPESGWKHWNHLSWKCIWRVVRFFSFAQVPSANLYGVVILPPATRGWWSSFGLAWRPSLCFSLFFWHIFFSHHYSPLIPSLQHLYFSLSVLSGIMNLPPHVSSSAATPTCLSLCLPPSLPLWVHAGLSPSFSPSLSLGFLEQDKKPPSLYDSWHVAVSLR